MSARVLSVYIYTPSAGSKAHTGKMQNLRFRSPLPVATSGRQRSYGRVRFFFKLGDFQGSSTPFFALCAPFFEPVIVASKPARRTKPAFPCGASYVGSVGLLVLCEVCQFHQAKAMNGNLGGKQCNCGICPSSDTAAFACTAKQILPPEMSQLSQAPAQDSRKMWIRKWRSGPHSSQC
jgi:hypothetical protein